MTNYKPLTKIIKTDDGVEKVACRFYGTEQCRSIHTNGCVGCPVMAAILNQLHIFEEIYMERDANETNSG